jgi:hypothetical protein
MSATQVASVGAIIPANMVREYPSRMIRLHHRTPSKAKSIRRPSMNQYCCRCEALYGWGPETGFTPRVGT